MTLTREELINLIRYTSGEVSKYELTNEDAESILNDFLSMRDTVYKLMDDKFLNEQL